MDPHRDRPDAPGPDHAAPSGAGGPSRGRDDARSPAAVPGGAAETRGTTGPSDREGVAPDAATPAVASDAPGRTALDAFLAAHGPIDVAWREGGLRWLRWACAALAALILLGFTQFAEMGLALRFAEVALALGLLLAFVWLRRASPAGGGVRVDTEGVRLLPGGPHLSPDDIEAIAVGPAPRGGRALLLRTRASHAHHVPLRARLRGHEGRIDLPRAP